MIGAVGIHYVNLFVTVAIAPEHYLGRGHVEIGVLFVLAAVDGDGGQDGRHLGSDVFQDGLVLQPAVPVVGRVDRDVPGGGGACQHCRGVSLGDLVGGAGVAVDLELVDDRIGLVKVALNLVVGPDIHGLKRYQIEFHAPLILLHTVKVHGKIGVGIIGIDLIPGSGQVMPLPGLPAGRRSANRCFSLCIAFYPEHYLV